jgi:hypothetical protein
MSARPLIPRLRIATDSAAEVELRQVDGSASAISGVVYGPRCEYARTLPTQFRVADGRVTIPEPCYWTPKLPFLYELAADESGVDGVAAIRTLGLRRLAARGPSLYWESRRMVLRGARLPALAADRVAAVRSAEAAVLLQRPSREQCAIGDRYGVALVADERSSPSANEVMERLAGSPSVALVLFRADQLPPDAEKGLGGGCLLTACLRGDEAPPAWADALAVEVGPAERPPAALADAGKPVIVIRRGAPYPDVQAARSACDRLQAELAPQFDLAGYFVTE